MFAIPLLRNRYPRHYSTSSTTTSRHTVHYDHQLTTLCPSYRHPPDTPRSKRLLDIYQPVRDLGIGTPAYYEALRSGNVFLKAFPLFRDYRDEHEKFMTHHPQLAAVTQTPHVYRVDSKLALQLTEWSCKLEGNTLEEQELEGILPYPHQPLPETPPSFPKNTRHTEKEYNEAYFHHVALYHAQGLLTSRTSQIAHLSTQLSLSVKDITDIHKVLMFPFAEFVPGRIRQNPISVNSHDLAVFPYPIELPSLLEALAMWTERPVAMHPILFASDLFLNFTHLHPFRDGNGRLGRLLFNLSLANTGYRPIPFSRLSRAQYLEVVYEAQQMNNRGKFYKLVLDEVGWAPYIKCALPPLK